MNPSRIGTRDMRDGVVCDWQQREQLLLANYAMHSQDSEGRKYAEETHPYRSPFQRDRDRILHSAAFRRLSGKMQVFTGDMGDYHRTRLTHTHEVATVARTISRVLRLNEDLIEALALVHDIGHPPFGHSGEDALSECFRAQGGFSHNRFALILVEELETRYTTYPGLNLSAEVLAGQRFRISHSGEAPLLEVQVVDLADSLAYTAHDVDDALTLGLITMSELRGLDLVQRATEWGAAKSRSPSERAARQSLVHSLIDVQVADVLESSQEKLAEVKQLDSVSVQQLGIVLELSPIIASEREQLSQFLFDNVYRHKDLIAVRQRAANRVSRLVQLLVASPHILPPRWLDRAQKTGVEIAVRDYIAGMTDRFCNAQYRSLVELGETSARDW
ncbi:MAG: dNTP triphosphohydrolase [Pirellulaceae bacterium]